MKYNDEVSTFAWYKSSGVEAAVGSATAGHNTMSVTKAEHAAGEVEIPLLVTVAGNDGGHLVLAHYNSSATTTKYLSSGYIDAGGVFQEETDPTAFGDDDAVLYGTLTVTVNIDFGVVYSEGIRAGWSGTAGGQAYDAQDNPYSYSALPQYWTTLEGVSYSASTLISDLAGESVDVGVKQYTTAADYARGRLFERNAISGDDTKICSYYNNTTDTQKTAESEGDLDGYFKIATSVTLTGVNTAAGCEAATYYYYAWGGATDTPLDDTSKNTIQVGFEATVA